METKIKKIYIKKNVNLLVEDSFAKYEDEIKEKMNALVIGEIHSKGA